MSDGIARHTESTDDSQAMGAGEAAYGLTRSGRTDAVSSGIVSGVDAVATAELKGARKAGSSVKAVLGRAMADAGDGEEADAGDQAAGNMGRLGGTALQSHRNMRGKIAAIVAEEADEADETRGARDVYSTSRDARRLADKARALKKGDAVAKKGGAKAASKAKDAKAAASKAHMQSRRTWLRARAVGEKAAATAATNTAKGGAAKAIAAALSSAAAPLGGILAGIIGFILVVLMISQLVSALFGFWENESYKSSMAGLPPYITSEMVLTALECQEAYGHPAGCTIAQIICESGQGDHLSGLATQDNNLFGIKWAERYGLEPEVTGSSAWETGEEYDGQYVTIIAYFTSFISHKDCIVFRSRVFLQASRYAQNALIQEAMATHSSDKMAEGLKDAGYATSSSYVESLKSVMATYNLYRFDTMTAEQFKSIGLSGDAIVAAAQSQLGVPYVWGGTTPGVGLDCSGLTQYCYACAGISIPRNSETQHASGRSIPLSEAVPGDILWSSGHVAIYIGGDSYIHAPQTGDVVRVATGISWFTCAVSYR